MTEEISPDLVLLWRLRDTPKRGPKPGLTVDDIVTAAVEVADAEGLDAVSMARVAAHLGNSTMALYRHVKSKRELLLLMADAALEEPPEFPPDGDWRAGMTLWARGVFGAVSRHKWLINIPISAPPFGPRNLMWFDRGLGTLRGVDIPHEMKYGLVMGLVTYVQGGYRLALELAAGYAENPAAFSDTYAAGLRKVIDPHQLPALAEMVQDGFFEGGEDFEPSDTRDFDYGLSVYLDGVAAQIQQFIR